MPWAGENSADDSWMYGWPAVADEAPVWADLGKTEAQRLRYWWRWLHTPLTEKELAAVRRSVTSGRPFGCRLGIFG